MNVRFTYLVLGLALLSPGCLAATGTRVLCFRFNRCLEDRAERRRNARWAEEAWELAAKQCDHGQHSDDYAWGFKDGFAEYLYRGRAEPPPLPPEHYRSVRYQSAPGYQAIQDWFSGYRDGAAAAQQGGQRDWITGPSSLRGPGAIGPTLPPAGELVESKASPPVSAPVGPLLEAPTPGSAGPSGGWQVKFCLDLRDWKCW